ncbi:MAG: outer membrane beta-barrel protein, partial [Eudoraea sp.]|nr:outer membrane beta-barrel protein [Eudoraea sp.]
MKKFNIDQAFKDRLKDYQESPDERVWESIAASLDEKKSKKRVIPIWWRLGGIAAALALLLYIFLPQTSEISTEKVTDIEQPELIEKSATPDDNELKENIREQDALAGQDNVKEAGEMSEDAIRQESASAKRMQNQEGAKVIAANEKDGNNKEGKKQEDLFKTGVNETGIDNELKEQDTRLAENRNIQENITEETATDPGNPSKIETVVAVTDEEQKLAEDGGQKKSIFDALEEQEEEVVAENNSNRWSLGPMVAPVYFNTLAEGSPIHSNFVSNSKSGNVNLSYGVAVSYQLTKKLSVRSGVHRVDYGYDTDEIEFSSSLSASTNALIDNIDYDSNSRSLVVESQTGRGVQSDAANAVEVNAPSPAREGRMVQDFGYLEVPVELQYNLVDSKLGINLIGGVSSLFLTQNSVTLVSDNTSTSMGEANNINEVNFSTNFGLGMYYRLTPKMQLNLEPMFKYQLNTFSDTAGNFQPFSIGV